MIMSPLWPHSHKAQKKGRNVFRGHEVLRDCLGLSMSVSKDGKARKSCSIGSSCSTSVVNSRYQLVLKPRGWETKGGTAKD